jgi:hypothetical protein
MRDIIKWMNDRVGHHYMKSINVRVARRYIRAQDARPYGVMSFKLILIGVKF